MNAIGKHRLVKKTSEMAHLRGRVCFHILKSMVQNNKNVEPWLTVCAVLLIFLKFSSYKTDVFLKNVSRFFHLPNRQNICFIY